MPTKITLKTSKKKCSYCCKVTSHKKENCPVYKRKIALSQRKPGWDNYCGVGY